MARLREEIIPAAGEFGVALTAGPVTMRSMPSVSRNDVQGTMVFQGSNLAKRALESSLVLASGEFVALAATEGARLEGFQVPMDAFPRGKEPMRFFAASRKTLREPQPELGRRAELANFRDRTLGFVSKFSAI